MENQTSCEHIRQAATLIQPKEYICEECIKSGDDWVHLRTCQTCGITLCCDSSSNKHMTRHYHHTHPLVISAEPGEKRMWFYQDEVFAPYT